MYYMGKIICDTSFDIYCPTASFLYIYSAFQSLDEFHSRETPSKYQAYYIWKQVTNPSSNVDTLQSMDSITHK